MKYKFKLSSPTAFCGFGLWMMAWIWSHVGGEKSLPRGACFTSLKKLSGPSEPSLGSHVVRQVWGLANMRGRESWAQNWQGTLRGALWGSKAVRAKAPSTLKTPARKGSAFPRRGSNFSKVEIKSNFCEHWQFLMCVSLPTTFPRAKVIYDLLPTEGQPRGGNPPWEEGGSRPSVGRLYICYAK